MMFTGQRKLYICNMVDFCNCNILTQGTSIILAECFETQWPVCRNGRAFAREPKGHGFEFWPVLFQVTAFGKLLTRMCLLQYNLVPTSGW